MQTIERGDGAITALTTFRDGFIAACGDKKLAIYTYLMDDAKRGTFGEIYSTELPEDLQTLHYIAMSPSEQSLLCMSVTNQVCGTKFHSPKAEIEVVKKETPINAEETNDETLDEEAVFEEQQAAARYNDLFLDDALLNQSASDGDKQSATISEEEKQREKKKTQQEMFEMYQPVEPFSNLLQPLHHGRITGMDTCIRKPIIVTSSTDRSVRLWNYVDNSLVIMKYFQEDATSVAIHPSGLYLLVGFSDKLRLLSVLNDDMRLYKEYPIRNCREVFVNGVLILD